MPMRIAPSANHSTTHTRTRDNDTGAPSASGLHDVLRHGIGPALPSTGNAKSSSSSTAPVIDSAHPLEARLAQWTATQDALKMEGLRRTFGMAEPIRRGMELKMCREGEWRPSCLGGGVPGLHEEILMGRDTMIAWEDVYTGQETRAVRGMQEEVEGKVRMMK